MLVWVELQNFIADAERGVRRVRHPAKICEREATL